MRVLIGLLMFVAASTIHAQNFDNLNANYGTNKSITWYTSNWGSGFGHRIINSDPGGKTLLNFQGRQNSTTWSDILTLTSNGLVGIGTSNPESKFQINSGLDNDLIINSTSSSTGLAGWSRIALRRNNELEEGFLSFYGNQSSGLILGVSGNNPLRFYTNDRERIRILSNGSVGIGTSNPNAKLDIYGANANTTNLILSANYVNKYRWRIKTRDLGAAIDMDFTASDANDTEETVLKLTRSTSGRPEFQLYNNAIVANNGNVGIGTATPDSKLSVNGNIHAKEVKVDLVGWPDYVFEKEYKLPTLDQVETHIKEKGHLQNIPSAQEVAENGIELGEMNKKLLEKIEELTLYTIAQEKRIEALEKQNARINYLEEKLSFLLSNKN